MPACCVCYTTDSTYLFPSFVSALQARRQARKEDADVLIIAFDLPEAMRRAYADACAKGDVVFLHHGADAIGGAPTMLARLFLADLLPPQYERFVYIDGDTQITGSLDQLLQAPPAAGRFLAASDPMCFAAADRDRHGQDIAAHFASLGMADQAADAYFNTGVIFADRAGWRSVGEQAWELFSRNRKATRFPDQDVLNLVGADRRDPMSLAWNFPIFMKNAGVESSIRPRIYHYMSQPKPWNGAFPPWGRSAYQPYIEVARRFPELRVGRLAMKPGRHIRYHLQQRYKRAVEYFAWARSLKKARILASERQVAAWTHKPKVPQGSSNEDFVLTRAPAPLSL